MSDETAPDNARDPRTPDDVAIRMEPARPYPDPTLGVPVAIRVWDDTPCNRLVTIGDSLTHGFQSGAIFNTRNSWPRLVAWEMGIDDTFRFPTYAGHGGLPLNIEHIIRKLEQEFGDKINFWELPLAGMEIRDLMSRIEDWWERGPGTNISKSREILHNLAVYGWDLRDALSWDFKKIDSKIANPSDDLFQQIVEDANFRAARRVYSAARADDGRSFTAFEAAGILGSQGAIKPDGTLAPKSEGIETLAVLLGANNALGTILSLKVRWSAEGYDDLAKKWKARFTIWRPTHFEAELKQVVAAIEKISARHVVIGNVPHVTIAPLARGIGQKVRPDSRYFPYYTRPWITDEQFDPHDDAHLTEQQARAIDCAIDQYNMAIATAVEAARKRGLDWYLFDLCGILDRLAQRRYIESPQARPAWWTPYDLPPELLALNPVPNTRFFSSGPQGRRDGGLFSLDGVHPTTIAYGIVAQEFIRVLERAGVPFFFGNGQTRRPTPVRVDFNRIIALDTLISSPPTSLDSDKRLIGWLDESIDLFKRVWPF